MSPVYLNTTMQEFRADNASAVRPTLIHLVSALVVVIGFDDLVVLAGVPHPIPFRTRSLSPPAPMVLCLKAWESRSLPGLQSRLTSRPKGRGLLRFALRPQ